MEKVKRAENEIIGDIAQLGERLPCKQEVAGSIPTISTTYLSLKRKVSQRNFILVLPKSRYRFYREWIEAFKGLNVSIWFQERPEIAP